MCVLCLLIVYTCGVLALAVLTTLEQDKPVRCLALASSVTCPCHAPHVSLLRCVSYSPPNPSSCPSDPSLLLLLGPSSPQGTASLPRLFSGSLASPVLGGAPGSALQGQQPLFALALELEALAHHVSAQAPKSHLAKCSRQVLVPVLILHKAPSLLLQP